MEERFQPITEWRDLMRKKYSLERSQKLRNLIDPELWAFTHCSLENWSKDEVNEFLKEWIQLRSTDPEFCVGFLVSFQHCRGKQLASLEIYLPNIPFIDELFNDIKKMKNRKSARGMLYENFKGNFKAPNVQDQFIISDYRNLAQFTRTPQQMELDEKEKVRFEYYYVPKYRGKMILYVRESWFPLWEILDNLRKNNQNLLLEGMNGIGKASFVWHWCLVYCSKNPTHTLVWIVDFFGMHAYTTVVISMGKIYWQRNIPDLKSLKPDVIVFGGEEKKSKNSTRDFDFCDVFKADEFRNSLIILIRERGQFDLTPEQIKECRLRNEKMYGWKFEEYEKACESELFLKQVLPSFTDDKTFNISDRRAIKSLLLDKFYFAGACSNYMFNYSCSQIFEAIGVFVKILGGIKIKDAIFSEFFDKLTSKSVYSIVSLSAVVHCATSRFYPLILECADSLKSVIYEMKILRCLDFACYDQFELQGIPAKVQNFNNQIEKNSLNLEIIPDESEKKIILLLKNKTRYYQSTDGYYSCHFLDFYVDPSDEKLQESKIQFNGKIANPIIIEAFVYFQKSEKTVYRFFPYKFKEGSYECFIIEKPQFQQQNETQNQNQNQNQNQIETNHKNIIKKGLIRMIQITQLQNLTLKLEYLKEFIDFLSNDELFGELKMKKEYELSISIFVPPKNRKQFSVTFPDNFDFLAFDQSFPNWKNRIFVYGCETCDVEYTLMGVSTVLQDVGLVQ